MKLLTWNCNMAFRKKKEQALKLNPDILIIQECEDPNRKGKWQEFSNYIWVGDNRNKGIGIFSKNNYDIEILDNVKKDYSKYVILVKIIGDKEELILLAIWAMNNKKDRKKRYIGQVYTAIKYYAKLLDNNIMIAGDLNWNSMWDKSPDSPLYGNLNDTTKLLNNKGLYSVYHNLRNKKFGEELSPTFYMYRKRKRPYHIDYIFMHEDKFDYVKDFWIGKYENWIDYSDHMPLFIDIEDI